MMTPDRGGQSSAVPDNPACRAYSARTVQQLTSLSRTSIWRLARAKQFPSAVPLSPGRVGYDANAVDRWLAARFAGEVAP